jgi:hypothetical protein
MRIWDVPPSILCRKHLLAEHRELHGLWNILVDGKKGYSRHPETLRWRGKLKALFERHEALVLEMARRGYRHQSLLDPALAAGSGTQNLFLDSPEAQWDILRAKNCDCPLDHKEAAA